MQHERWAGCVPYVCGEDFLYLRGENDILLDISRVLCAMFSLNLYPLDA